MGSLPAQALAAVPHVSFGVFNLALPNILAWLILALLFTASVFARLPRFFEARSEAEDGASPAPGDPVANPEAQL